jgi:acyl-lipid omega-3 desaturase
MAPRSNATESSAKTTSEETANKMLETTKTLKLNDLRKALPSELFVKSLPTSVFYLVFDVTVCLATLYVMHTLVNSSQWEDLGGVLKGAAWLVYWNVMGFFMWCLFVVGHDCGHGTFSEYEWLNDIIGHITHGAILVPYYPWQLTHRRHHMYHNHVDKDYSHPWYTEEREKASDEGLYRFFRENSSLMATFPLFGWTAYLLGSPDGSHFFPIPSQRMWKESPSVEYTKCLVSTAVVFAYAYGVYAKICEYDFSVFSYYYLIPILVFGWWLVCVTYLQHHCPTTMVYDSDSWNFFTAAFETVDRTFGYGIDDLSHNITDGHVVHHLFYTKIPHYHLKKATRALRKYLSDNNASHLYKHEETYDFAFRVHQYFRDIGYGATLYKEGEGNTGKKQK